ncbi:exported hypothetical protein [Frankia sp. AiPs1]|uniref:hypothetical protein n=1 Tax=Frankia sp. AiPa1 TaxID=573492 RepID=UPI00202AF17A|nr:hypothetical protein [Frankia sp. AiPa1]MCL9758772.1 hypothetical protein [Frankia sp. AiPa1]
MQSSTVGPPWPRRVIFLGVSACLFSLLIVHSAGAATLGRYQRDVTVRQVDGTGVAPANGTGSLSFRLHLSAPAPAIGSSNRDPFVLYFNEQANNGTADKANGIYGRVTVPPGVQNITVAIRVRGPARSIQLLLTGNGKHVPRRVLFTIKVANGIGDRLVAASRLNPGDALTSPNGRYHLIMQSDGNLVEYDSGLAVWASNTGGHPGSDLEAQSDGNFTVYAPGHIAIWASNTRGRNGRILRIQNDRNLTIYAPGNVAVWSSNSAV